LGKRKIEEEGNVPKGDQGPPIRCDDEIHTRYRRLFLLKFVVEYTKRTTNIRREKEVGGKKRRQGW